MLSFHPYYTIRLEAPASTVILDPGHLGFVGEPNIAAHGRSLLPSLMAALPALWLSRLRKAWSIFVLDRRHPSLVASLQRIVGRPTILYPGLDISVGAKESEDRRDPIALATDELGNCAG